MAFSDLSVATLNINGMNNYNKRQDFLLWFRNQGVDVLCLQEVHVDSMQRASVWGAESPIFIVSGAHRLLTVPAWLSG